MAPLPEILSYEEQEEYDQLDRDFDAIEAALTRDNSEAIRLAREALESGYNALSRHDIGANSGADAHSLHLMLRAIAKLNAALGEK